MQLDLFLHAPRFYHLALERLGALDLDGCRRALERHRREGCGDRDPGPVADAAAWLQVRLAEVAEPAEAGGGTGAVLALCRRLREGDGVPPPLAPDTSAARAAVRQLAARGLEALGGDAEGRERGQLALLAGCWRQARDALRGHLRRCDADPGAWLALAEACDALGAGPEARRAAREGYGLDPDGHSWGPAPAWAADLRREYRDDPEFAGRWWVVGAYLDGRLPRFEGAPQAVVDGRLERFLGGAELLDPAAAPVRFCAGLFLSEHGALLSHASLTAVRRAMRSLHPEAFARHLEQLDRRRGT